MNDLYGYKVVIDDATYEVPNRKLPARHWHEKRCYAMRVQKKWICRFGTHRAYVIADEEIIACADPPTMVMNPKTWDAVKRRVQTGDQLAPR